MVTAPLQAVPDAPLIEVSGSPDERGRQYGEAARTRIEAGLGHYSEQLAKTKLTRDELRELVESFLPRIDAFDATYVTEMRGIAAGSNRPLEDIVLLNARTEILKLGPKAAKAKGREVEEDPDGCTGVVAMPGVTADGKLIHAQNWDWKVDCAETAVVLKIRREDGPDILTFTEAGQLARSGMNSAGIAITANYLECERDYRQIGVPLGLIRRKVLQQSTLALAMRAAYCTPKSASNNIIISQSGGIAINFECAPDESFQIHPENGLIVHANHWLSPVALGKLTDTGIETTPDSLYRDLRVRQLVEPHRGRITLDTVKHALFDDYQSPWSVCRPPRLNLSSNLSATVAMVAMVPEDGILDVAMLPALNRNFTRHRLVMDEGVSRHRLSASQGA
ncbi:MAG: C45 family autoproteolytic acyltransferase/hydrolase [Beijerinckiaceae bacterium]